MHGLQCAIVSGVLTASVGGGWRVLAAHAPSGSEQHKLLPLPPFAPIVRFVVAVQSYLILRCRFLLQSPAGIWGHVPHQGRQHCPTRLHVLCNVCCLHSVLPRRSQVDLSVLAAGAVVQCSCCRELDSVLGKFC